MTTPPADPQPSEDMEDGDAGGVAPADTSADTSADAPGEQGADSEDADAMGIDDEDPIDATLVGSPVDDDGAAHQQDASTEPAGDEEPAQ